MDAFAVAMDELLANMYRHVVRMEKRVLEQNNRIPLSTSELHLLTALGKKKDGRTMSTRAHSLGITPSSTTTAVSKLEKKGFVQRMRSLQDDRVVRVALTPKGKQVDMYYRVCLREMVEELGRSFSLVEKDALVKIVRKINEYFQ